MTPRRKSVSCGERENSAMRAAQGAQTAVSQGNEKPPGFSLGCILLSRAGFRVLAVIATGFRVLVIVGYD
jgi:hypothetical protein